MKKLILLIFCFLTAHSLLAASPPVAVLRVANEAAISPLLHQISDDFPGPEFHYVIIPGEQSGPVLLDGSASYDPDRDPLRFLWSECLAEDNCQAITGLPMPAPAILTLNLAPGSFLFGLNVYDGTFNSPLATIKVAVYTPSGMLFGIREVLDELADSQPIPTTVKPALANPLTDAARSFMVGNTPHALHQIKLFENHLKSQPKYLDAATRQALIDAAEAVVAAVGNGP